MLYFQDNVAQQFSANVCMYTYIRAYQLIIEAKGEALTIHFCRQNTIQHIEEQHCASCRGNRRILTHT
jgi:hypothetical protein